MTEYAQDVGDDERVREIYEEFEVGDTTVAMISDPLAETAWIQSDVVCEVDA